ncbi:MAG: hypothetical protein B7Y02_14220 [Rhodobacterales bacterium 17-64-5]|nr:MAG: hypothetical protein B7Y02_14220 [Rhodobacterales bacterium 17-64-5]
MFSPIPFRIITDWRVKGRLTDVVRLLTTPETFPIWWSDVYLAVRPVAPGDARGVGHTVAIRSRGWLGYRLHWNARLIEADLPHRWVIEATGEVKGRGTWRLRQAGDVVEIEFDWQVTSSNPLVRRLTPLFGWLMRANHNWAMTRGETALKDALAKLYRAKNLPDLAAYPPGLPAIQ